jgi:hypothetical protein
VAEIIQNPEAFQREGDRAAFRIGFFDAGETRCIKEDRRPGDRPPVRFGQRFQPHHLRVFGKPERLRRPLVGGLQRVAEQNAAPVLRLSPQALRKAGPHADRIGKAPPSFDEGAAPLLGAQHALLHQRGDRAAHGMAVDAEPLGQRHFRRQAIRELAGTDGKPYPVGDLAPERDAALPLHPASRFRHLFCPCHAAVIDTR